MTMDRKFAVEHTNGIRSMIVVPKPFRPGDGYEVRRCTKVACLFCEVPDLGERMEIGEKQRARSEALGG